MSEIQGNEVYQNSGDDLVKMSIQNAEKKIQDSKEESSGAVEDDYHDQEEEDEEEDDDDEELEELCRHGPPSTQPGFIRDPNPDLSENVTMLITDEGCKVYIVGTAHFSKESQSEVIKTVETVKPDFVLLELCQSRVSILSLDEETLIKEAKNINMAKVQRAIKQNGLIQGIMHLLLLSMSAHMTEQLGMAPGGEFRVALQEARKIHGCQIILGDRAIQITLHRALASLSWWQTIRLAWYILTSKEPISAEDVEKYKKKDFLEEMLREMTGEFPALSRVFVEERDLYLAKTLYNAAHLLPKIKTPSEEGEGPEWTEVPSAVVGVVGIGHVPGITRNWDTIKDTNIVDLMTVPKPSKLGVTMKWTIKAAFVVLLSWSCYKGYKLTASLF